MSVDPRHKMFHDEDAARAYFEEQRWPDGPVCPHCNSKHARRLEGEAHRKGLIQCNDCLGQFSVTLNSVMESSHIPLTKWVLGFHKMAASKKGISAKQLQRELALGSYRTAWFMAMRIREAMGLDAKAGPIGGSGKTVESDETFVGGKKKTSIAASLNQRSTPFMHSWNVAVRFAPATFQMSQPRRFALPLQNTFIPSPP